MPMPHMHSNPIVAVYPDGDFQCVQDCIDGVCTDSIADKIQSHLNAISYVQGQQFNAGCPPCPCPCPPCSTAEFTAFHWAKGNVKGASTSLVERRRRQDAARVADLPWAALFALLEPLLLQLLAQLFPPTPTPPTP